MYVCLCEAVTDHQIRQAVESGASTVTEVMRCTRAGTCCGACKAEIAETVAAAQAAQGAHGSHGSHRHLDMHNPFAECPRKAA